MPKVSVVMPVYNRVHQVSRAIDSILAQSYEDFELIVVDDGSQDGTIKVVEHYAKRDNRVRLLSLPSNGGQGLARALGNDAAKGEYIAVMDSDDRAAPRRLALQTEFLDQHPDITLVGGQATKVFSDASVRMDMLSGDAQLKALLLMMDCAFVHPTVMIRKAFMRQHNLNYSAERRGDDDFEFYLRMVEAGANFYNMPDQLVEYFRHEGNISANTPRINQDKTPLRARLLSLYYPELTVSEIQAIAKIMQTGASLSAKQAYQGILAAEKAQTMQHSYFGEDHAYLNQILQRAIMIVTKALNKSGHQV